MDPAQITSTLADFLWISSLAATPLALLVAALCQTRRLHLPRDASLANSDFSAIEPIPSILQSTP